MSRADSWSDADLRRYVPGQDTVDASEWEPCRDEPDDKAQTHTIACQVCGEEWDPKVGHFIGNRDDELDRGCYDCKSYRELQGRTEHYGSGVGVREDWY